MIKNIHVILLLYFILTGSGTHAQTGLDSVLASVEQRNKLILSTRQLQESQKASAVTGLYPSNPFFEYDYLQGSPSTAGDQHEIQVIQSFDFPTVYTKKRKLSGELSLYADLNYRAVREEVLLDAKQTCIEIVYCRKLQNQLEVRLKESEKILNAVKLKLDKGEGNILDLNKTRLMMTGIRQEYAENLNMIRILEDKLSGLNGGQVIAYSDTSYFIPPAITSFDALESECEMNDPHRKILLQEEVIARKELELSRSLRLPKMELGYRYQGLTGNKYNGIHTGISIPLWENSGQVKLRELKANFKKLEVESHKTIHYYEIKRKYDRIMMLREMMEEYSVIFRSNQDLELLSKAFRLGEISLPEYYLETTFYYEAYKKYLITEKEYYSLIADLFKFQL